MLFESTAIAYSIGVPYLYYLVYRIPGKKPVAAFRVDLVVLRILVALAVEFVFNSIAVLFQIRYMNIPVIRVWKCNWRKHLVLNFITTVFTLLFFTGFMTQLTRAEYKADKELVLVANCTKYLH